MSSTASRMTERRPVWPARRSTLVAVGDVLRSPSRPLDERVRAENELRFGRDLSGVRVHTDERAARSAQALGAAAYTVGSDVVFGRGRYAPGLGEGRRLLAHELTHVVQQDSRSRPERVEVGPAADELEQAATAHADRAGTRGPARVVRSRGGVRLQRSLLGGLGGALLGAAAGAAFGAFVSGPLGAVVGGLVGLVAGALIGDAATTRKRSLTPTEIAYAKEIFRDTIDYSEVTITRDSMISTGAPKTIANTVHLRSDPDWGHFVGDTLDLTQRGLETLIHELGHVWQYQNGGLAYIPESLVAQAKGFLGSGDRDAAYEWREAHRAGLPWEKWNPEQQAQAIEDYNKLLRKSKDGTATVAELAELSTLLPYMQQVWARQGAPSMNPPDLKDSPL
jgi:outer membrane lipoprotein SlyB